MTAPELDETTIRVLRSMQTAANEIAETEFALAGLHALQSDLTGQLMTRLLKAAGIEEEG